MAIKTIQKKIHGVRNYRVVQDGDVFKLVADDVTEIVEQYIDEHVNFRNNQLISVPQGRKVVSSEKKLIEYPLQELSIPEIIMKKRCGIPSLVIKYHEKLFWTKISKRLNLSSSKLFGDHKCSCGQQVCDRLVALPQELDGCEKVRRKAKDIWRYDFIEEGYETFNVNADCNCLVVGKCKLHKPAPDKPKLTWREIEIRRKNIYDFVYE